jgi:hypothetical protein
MLIERSVRSRDKLALEGGMLSGPAFFSQLAAAFIAQLPPTWLGAASVRPGHLPTTDPPHAMSPP